MADADMEALVGEYGNEIYAFCRRLAYSREDADDLFQQTFLKAMELKRGIRADGNPKSFLISISVGIWRNTVRKRGRRGRIAPEEPIAPENVPGEGSAEGAALKAELRGEVRRAVAGLKEKQRLPVLMHYMLDMPLPEIARILGVPQGTVKSRLHKARAIIKDGLEAADYGKD